MTRAGDRLNRDDAPGPSGPERLLVGGLIVLGMLASAIGIARRFV